MATERQCLPHTVHQSISLASLTQTSPLAYLPCPVDAAPSDVSPSDDKINSADSAIPHETVLVHIRQLLGAAATTYTASTSSKDPTAVSCSPLARALLETDPRIFDCQHTGDDSTRPPPPATPSTSTSVFPPAGPMQDTLSVASRVETSQPTENQEAPPGRPVVKRRRTSRSRLSSAAVPLPAQPPAEQSAASLQAALDAFLSQKAATEVDEAAESQNSSDEEQTGTVAGSDVRKLRLLNAALLQAQHSPAIRAMPAEQVRQVLQQLSKWIGLARDAQLIKGEEADSHSCSLISISLDACLATLRILTSSHLDPRLRDEESVERMLTCLRCHMLASVLVFYDARLRQLHRPGLNDHQPGDAEPDTPKSTGKLSRRNSRVQEQSTPAAASLLGRMQAALQMLAQLLGCVRLQGNSLLPMLRVACQTLTVQGLEVLQLAAVELIVSAFQHYVSLRGPILEEAVASMLPNLDCQQCIYPVGMLHIHVASALIVQLLQVSTQLPAMDTQPEALQDCWKVAWSWADSFWNACFDRLAQKGQRSDQDMRQLLDRFLADMLALQHYPEWPAAAVGLVRFVVTVAGPRGLKHSDSTVRSTSVDLLGTLVMQLYWEAGMARAEQPWLSQILGPYGEVTPALLQELLLSHLLQAQSSGNWQLCSSAREHLLCGTLYNGIGELQQREASADEQLQLLGSCRELAAQREAVKAELVSLDSDSAIRVARAVVQAGRLGDARGPLLAKLLEAANPLKQAAAGTRAKAIKALAGVIKVERQLLESGHEQGMVLVAISSALKDEAASVRQAAVDLLGTNIGHNAELATIYFDIIRFASHDSFPSVRKAAIKILWESCITAPGFTAACEACVAVLKRVNDAEESIQELVGKVFHGLWFADAAGEVQNGATATTMEQRAQQLADVAATLYDAADSRSIRLPLQPSHLLVIALRKALDRELKSGGSVKSQMAAGRKLADALLEGFLQAQDEGQSCFSHVMALHALTITEPGLCMPPEDAEKFCRCLAPYLKSSAADRRAAEQLMCILHIEDALLLRLGHVGRDLEMELQGDLRLLIGKQSWMQVVKAACRCLGSLACVSSSAAQQLALLAAHFFTKLQAHAEQGVASQQDVALCSRNLFLLGHVLQYGAAAVEAHASALDSFLTCEAALSTFVTLFRSNAGTSVQGAALHAMGCLAIARPAVMLTDAARGVMRDVLSRGATTALKIRALSNLHDMMQDEEETVKASQKEQTVQQADAEMVDLKQEIGEGDGLSVSGGIIQENWALVLDLATDTPAHIASASGSNRAAEDARAQAEQVRRHAVNVIDDVNRNGLAPPWEAIPHLVAATTDPNWDVAARALTVLGRLNEKQPDMLQRLVGTGLDVAAAFHMRLRQGAENLHWNITGVPKAVDRGLGAIYSSLLHPKPAVRLDFLKSLIRRFDALCSLRGSAKSDELSVLTFHAHVASALPFKRGDEPCALIYSISSLIASKAESILAALKPCYPDAADADGVAANGMASAEATTVPEPSAQSVQLACNASLAASLLLLLKHQLIGAYSLTPERVAAYHPSDAERRKAEEQRPISRRDAKPGFHALHMHAAGNLSLMQEQYKVFSGLLEADSADCGQDTPLADLHAGLLIDEEAVQDPETTARTTAGRRSSTSRGRARQSAGRAGQRGSTGRRSTGSKAGRGRGRGAKRKRRVGMGSDDESDSSDAAADEEGSAIKKRLDL